MDVTPVLITGFVLVLVAVVAFTVLGSIRQQRRRSTQPARHVGDRQSQRGRVFKHGTNHSKYPDSW